MLIVKVTTAALSCAILVGASACARTDAPSEVTYEGTTYQRDVLVDARLRTYRVHVPAKVVAAETPAPVVLVLHGGAGNGVLIERHSGFTDAADRFGFVVVYPDGTGRTRLLAWNAGGCCGYAYDSGVDDVAFVSALLDSVFAEFPVDPDRVYVTGFSNGAMLSYRLACELSDQITAFAPVAGSLTVDPCRPSRPLPLLVAHGTADAVVPYEGTVSHAVSVFTRHNGCPAPPAESNLGTATVTTYGPCAGGSEVVVYRINGGGHAWPGADITAAIWRFFSRH